MKANELRLDNWVQVNGIPRKVVMIQTKEVARWFWVKCCDFGDDVVVMVDGYDSYFDCTGEELIPIPITEEILLKCGFNLNERTGDYDLYHGNNYITVFKRGIEWGISIEADNTNIKVMREYLHELQNFYYLATGEELEVEL